MLPYAFFDPFEPRMAFSFVISDEDRASLPPDFMGAAKELLKREMLSKGFNPDRWEIVRCESQVFIPFPVKILLRGEAIYVGHRNASRGSDLRPRDDRSPRSRTGGADTRRRISAVGYRAWHLLLRRDMFPKLRSLSADLVWDNPRQFLQGEICREWLPSVALWSVAESGDKSRWGFFSWKEKRRVENYRVIVGTVQLLGDGYIHERGYRSQGQEILELAVTDRTLKDWATSGNRDKREHIENLKQILHETYGVPVYDYETWLNKGEK